MIRKHIESTGYRYLFLFLYVTKIKLVQFINILISHDADPQSMLQKNHDTSVEFNWM